ncbi:DUF6483 family protein [Lachnospiraceae bacterium 62-26]
MNFEDEKDYIMRIIKEVARILFSLLFGRQYVSVEQELRDKYQVSGKNLDDLFGMIDAGDINEAENILLTGIDYGNRDDVAAAVLFYQYAGEKEEDFLARHNYSREEVLDGMKCLAEKAGYGDILNTSLD